MKKHYNQQDSASLTRELLIGLGETSVRKNYYPELQHHIAELERFRLLLNQTPEAIFLVELSTMRIVDLNETARLCLGNNSNLDLSTLESLFSTNLVDNISNLDEPRTLEGLFNCSSKGTIPAEITISRAMLHDTSYAVIVARNITERRLSEDRLQAAYEELHASYEELESLYGHLSTAEETLRKKINELEQSEARYRLAMEGANDAIWDWDLINDSLTISSHGYETLAITSETEHNHNAFWRSRIHPEDLPNREQALALHLSGESPQYDTEYRFSPTPGNWLWIRAKGKALFDKNGIPIRISGSLTDITEHKKHEQQIHYLAYHDTLTGLPNRFSFNKKLDNFIAQCESTEVSGGLFLLDIDNFKLVNDSLGHIAGDGLLQKVAQRLKAFYPAKSIAARLGGDDFAVLIREINLDELEYWAKSLLKLFDSPIAVNDMNLALSCSIGVTAVYTTTLSAAEVMREADTALNHAKAGGKKSFCLYKPEMQKAVLNRIELEHELRNALAANELIMHYQPEIDLETKQIVAFEALIRWKHPQKGLVPPLSFIPLAEETGLILPIGEFALRSACRFGIQVNKAQKNPIRISVNISARQLMQDDFGAAVCRIIAEENYPPELLELEITESILMESFAANVRVIEFLRSKGITISLDDFGSGYSSLTYLRKLPINIIKLDKDFIQNIVHDNATNSIVRTIISLAQNLNLPVVAEGVETIEQLETLRQLNCPYIQGYFISRPLPHEEALAFKVKI